MEPQLPTPHGSPETGPSRFTGGEVIPNQAQPERAPETAPERQETREQLHDGPKGDPAAVTATPALPPLPTITPPTTAAKPVTDDDNPPSAADDDLIEKEWVEKAKKVVAETKHDPYLQGQQVSRLQADYLKKRYGKTVSIPSDGA